MTGGFIVLVCSFWSQARQISLNFIPHQLKKFAHPNNLYQAANACLISVKQIQDLFKISQKETQPDLHQQAKQMQESNFITSALISLGIILCQTSFASYLFYDTFGPQKTPYVWVLLGGFALLQLGLLIYYIPYRRLKLPTIVASLGLLGIAIIVIELLL